MSEVEKPRDPSCRRVPPVLTRDLEDALRRLLDRRSGAVPSAEVFREAHYGLAVPAKERPARRAGSSQRIRAVLVDHRQRRKIAAVVDRALRDWFSDGGDRPEGRRAAAAWLGEHVARLPRRHRQRLCERYGIGSDSGDTPRAAPSPRATGGEGVALLAQAVLAAVLAEAEVPSPAAPGN